MKKKKKLHYRPKRASSIILITVSIIAIILLLAVSSVAIYMNVNGIDTDIDMSIFEDVGSDTVSRIYYFDDNGIAQELENEQIYGSHVTVYEDLANIPKNLQNAFIAVEDKRFYRHSGVDWYRTASAGLNYIFKFDKSFGASTITQQLIKNVTGDSEYSIRRKIQEMFYATDLERNMSKDEILEMYLNIVNLSQSCYGVGAAAQKYFSKDVSELTLIECACIASITKSPSYYDPINNPQNNAKRRDTVLTLMLEQGYISEEEYKEAYGKELVLKVSKDKEKANSWYTDMVISDIINDLREQLGYSEAAANLLVFSGGLKIYTAMDPDIQKSVEEYFENTDNFPQDDLEQGRCAMIIIDPYNGNILGVAGSIGEKSGDRLQNYAIDTLRPSGSTIKPLSVYAPALEELIINWSSVYDDVPIEFTENSDGSFKAWPNNATLTYQGLSNIEYAIENSLNTVAVRVLADLGEQVSYDYLKNKFNIENLIEADKGVAALALGQQNYGITLRELTAAYTAFANEGVCNESRSYILVQSRDGKVVLSREIKGEQVISEGNAAIMTKLLGRVTSTHATITLDDLLETAGKTGTTQHTCDRWFVGYTPYYLAGVWYGHEYPSTLPESAKSICSTVWNDVMTDIHEEIIKSGNAKSFELPENVIEASFCIDSGKLMTGACLADPRGDRSDSGWFIEGTQPTEFCDCHVLVDYDKEYGGIASPLCSARNITKVGLIKVERSFPMQITVTDAEYVWRELPDNISPCFSDDSAFFSNLLDEDEYCGISNAEIQYNRYCYSHSYPIKKE